MSFMGWYGFMTHKEKISVLTVMTSFLLIAEKSTRDQFNPKELKITNLACPKRMRNLYFDLNYFLVRAENWFWSHSEIERLRQVPRYHFFFNFQPFFYGKLFNFDRIWKGTIRLYNIESISYSLYHICGGYIIYRLGLGRLKLEHHKVYLDMNFTMRDFSTWYLGCMRRDLFFFLQIYCCFR